MEIDHTGRHSVHVTHICRHGVSAALQQLAAVGIHISLETELFGFTCTVQLPKLRLPIRANGNARDSAAARQRRRRSSLSSQGSSTLSSVPSLALSIGTVDEAVLTLRQRLSDPACGTAVSSGAVPSSVAAAREPLDGAAAGAVAAPPAGMTVADMLRASGEEMDDPCLLRWLAARDHDVDLAEASLRQHAQWRYNYVPNGRISEDEIRNELAVNKVFLQGCDKQGRAVMLVLAARHDMGTRRLEETNRLIVYVLDNAAAMSSGLRANPLGKFLCLFDLSGLRMNNLDVKALRNIFELLQGHFPERLSQLWFLNAPFIFWGLWRIVSPFIEVATREKIVFLTGAERTARLQEAIPPEVLPKQYGGRAEMVPAAEAVAARRAGQLQRRSSWRRSIAREAPAAEGRLSAAKGAVGDAFSSAWAGVKRGGSSVGRIRLPAPRLPSLPRPHLWWRSSDPGTAAAPGAAQQQLALMRQRSIALQQAVAQSRLGSAVAKSRFASASRRWGTKLQPLVSAKVLLCTVWAGARCVARWALGALFAAPQPAGPARQRLPRPPLGPVVLPASPLDGGLRPY